MGLHPGAVDPFLQRARHALFHAGIGVHDVPTFRPGCGGGSALLFSFCVRCCFSCHLSSIRSQRQKQRRTASTRDLVDDEQENGHDHHKREHDAGRVDRFLAATARPPAWFLRTTRAQNPETACPTAKTTRSRRASARPPTSTPTRVSSRLLGQQAKTQHPASTRPERPSVTSTRSDLLLTVSNFCVVIHFFMDARGRFLQSWQGRRESNPQPSVLETDALPIELRP